MSPKAHEGPSKAMTIGSTTTAVDKGIASASPDPTDGIGGHRLARPWASRVGPLEFARPRRPGVGRGQEVSTVQELMPCTRDSLLPSGKDGCAASTAAPYAGNSAPVTTGRTKTSPGKPGCTTCHPGRVAAQTPWPGQDPAAIHCKPATVDP